MSSTKKEITVGVENFRFLLKTHCVENSSMPIAVSLSFNLRGDFLPSALSDDLTKTVDYEALCKAIENDLSFESCRSVDNIVLRLQTAISRFSPLIFGGYFSLHLHCHDTFTRKGALV